MDMDESLEATPRLHTKRLAREIAMQFLFSCDMQNEFPEMGKFDDFFEEEMKSSTVLRITVIPARAVKLQKILFPIWH